MITQGKIIAGRYEVSEKIGTGGMSDVYKAKDMTLGRNVAIKVLKSEFSADMNFVTKFRSEAQAAAGLEHPNIVNIYDVGSEGDVHYIVMECVEGITLKTYIEKKGQLAFKEAASIAIQVARGIEAAHNKNIIHRDIKPQNIIISTDGKVKVTDFGIAKAASANTISSDVMGSVHYSSPEQARNGFVDDKTDIYSLGIVMYEMVTGRVPFDGDTTVAVAIQHLQEEMPSPSVYAEELPVSMEKIILKCTQKSPDRRYGSIAALLSDLRQSLISPEADFVVIAPVSQDKTRIIGAEEVEKIKKETGSIYVDEETLVGSTMKADKPELREEENYEAEYEEDDEDDDVNPGMDKAITILGIAAGVVIVILIGVILVNFLKGVGSDDDKTPSTQQSTVSTEQKDTVGSEIEGTIEVADLAGMTILEAKSLLNADGLGIKRAGTVASDEYEEGQIIEQVPAAGSLVLPNTTVEVIISSGPAMITIPSVKGLDETTAFNKLENAGFEPVKEYAYSNDVEKGKVISQSPGGNSLGNEGDTVKIVISKGKNIEYVTVPDVLGYDLETAKAILTDAGISPGNVTYEADNTGKYAKGTVMKQAKAKGEKVIKDGTVDLVVSLGVVDIEVPNVVGQTTDGAIDLLQGKGLKIVWAYEFSDTVPEGTVISQSIASGTKVKKDTELTVVISKGSAPTETPTEKPTETPTEKPTETPTEQPSESETQTPTEAPAPTETEAPAPTETTEAQTPTETTEAPANPVVEEPSEESSEEASEESTVETTP